MRKFLVNSLALIIFSQILVPVFSQSQCTSFQIFDMKLNKCIPNINCLTELDDLKCKDLDCKTSADQCPKKCYCEQPSALTNYCMPCLNGGVLDKNTCDCKCNYGFQGPRCQYPADPCKAHDDVYCSTVDCYNATDVDFFKCPNKCLCCQNLQCQNLGNVASDGSCKCECLILKNSIGTDLLAYDSTKNCALANCVDDHACQIQFVLKTKPENCNNSFVKALCPKSCNPECTGV